MEKYKVQVNDAIAMVHEMVKMVALAAEIGRDSSWIHNKYSGNIIAGKKKEFTQPDIDLINKGIQQIGERLLETNIEYSVEREAVIEQVRKVAETICMPYIYLNKLGKTKSWYFNRIKYIPATTARSSFKEKDILLINMCIREIAVKLLSIEVTL